MFLSPRVKAGFMMFRVNFWFVNRLPYLLENIPQPSHSFHIFTNF